MLASLINKGFGMSKRREIVADEMLRVRRANDGPRHAPPREFDAALLIRVHMVRVLRYHVCLVVLDLLHLSCLLHPSPSNGAPEPPREAR